jgi:mRNA-degrading endonuclease RelE of RelBE toxin-antitoxin system
VRVRFSRLAQEQLSEIPLGSRRKLLKAIRVQLTLFPASGQALDEELGPGYRQVLRGGYRLIYRYLPDEHELRFYYVGSARRLLPPEDLLRHQAF